VCIIITTVYEAVFFLYDGCILSCFQALPRNTPPNVFQGILWVGVFGKCLASITSMHKGKLVHQCTGSHLLLSGQTEDLSVDVCTCQRKEKTFLARKVGDRTGLSMGV